MSFARSFLGTVKYISQIDPALDKDAEGFDFLEYRKSLDEKHLKFHEGAEPSRFELAPLTRIQLTKVLNNPSPLDQCLDAVAYSLRSVSNFVVDGETITVEHKTVDGQKRVKPEVLDKLFDAVLFGELGAKVLELNRLNPTRG